MKSKISIITLGVSDFKKSFDFYTSGLGFTPHNYKTGDVYALFEMEGTWFSISP
jgi:catechol 2,3-dioxygenase-like lactoylglutathione lyase family enzyme